MWNHKEGVTDKKCWQEVPAEQNFPLLHQLPAERTHTQQPVIRKSVCVHVCVCHSTNKGDSKFKGFK